MGVCINFNQLITDAPTIFLPHQKKSFPDTHYYFLFGHIYCCLHLPAYKQRCFPIHEIFPLLKKHFPLDIFYEVIHIWVYPVCDMEAIHSLQKYHKQIERYSKGTLKLLFSYITEVFFQLCYILFSRSAQYAVFLGYIPYLHDTVRIFFVFMIRNCHEPVSV